MTQTANMVLGLVVGVIFTLVIPFAIAAPRLRRDYRRQREQWFADHPDWEPGQSDVPDTDTRTVTPE